MSGIREYNRKLNIFLGERQLLERQLDETQRKIRRSKNNLKRIKEAQQILQKAAAETQQMLEYHISNVCSLALAAVFPDPYEFRAKFVVRRNSTECDLLLVKDGNEISPMDAVGGGVIDIVSFGLRVAYWSIKPNRPVFVLDEPFRFLSVDLQERASEMLKTISEELGIQIIMVSHLPNIIGSADKVFKVKKVKGKSIVEEI